MNVAPPEPRAPPGPAAPYAGSLEHLRDELARSETLVRLAAARARRSVETTPPREADGFEAEGLFGLLEHGTGFRLRAAAPPPALAEAEVALDHRRAAIAARVAESARRGVPLRLETLAERFGLGRVDLDLLLLALLPDVDPEAERLLDRLDPSGRGRLTLGVALDLVAPSFEARLAAGGRLGPRAPLVHHQLLRVAADPSGHRASALGRALEVDERVAAHLRGDDAPDARLGDHVRLIVPRARLDDLILPEGLKRGLARLVSGPRDAAAPAGVPGLRGGGEPGPIIYLQGPAGTGKRALAEALCREAGAPLLAVDVAALAVADERAFDAAVKLALREARLEGAAVHWVGAGALLEAGAPAVQAALVAALAAHEGLVFLSGPAPWEPAGALGGRAFVRAELPRPSTAEQVTLWTRALGDGVDPAVDLAALAGAFRLTGGQIDDAAWGARANARMRGGAEGRVNADDLRAACRRRHGRKLAALARRVVPRGGWDDLVLPADRKATLREIALQLRHRGRVLGEWGFGPKLGAGTALSALFSGPPGTGKTMAASIIAAELGVDLYQVDLSQVVSKYIGETEKHLAELFADAEAASAALFFDEADALFGKRTEVKDAHDRHANLETSYLLQRVEAYEGVVILASNLVRNIDEAFVRRLAFVVEFPAPGAAERQSIWQGLFPAGAPLEPDLDFDFLAERVELSGGYLRNIALAAAFLAADEGAPVAMKHVLHAARREYQKMGKVLDAGRLAYAGVRECRP
jgi:AAA+ superfamily predicted ATPase